MFLHCDIFILTSGTSAVNILTFKSKYLKTRVNIKLYLLITTMLKLPLWTMKIYKENKTKWQWKFEIKKQMSHNVNNKPMQKTYENSLNVSHKNTISEMPPGH